jgi:hypothetical protein
MSFLVITHGMRAKITWFPAKKVLNHGHITHGSGVVQRNHREEALDFFILTVDRAAAFICPAITHIEFEIFDSKANFLHIGNDKNKKRTTTHKEKHLNFLFR